MPPEMPKDLTARTNGSLESSRRDVDALLGLYDLEGLSLALASQDFEILEEVDFLLTIMRDRTADTSHRLAAHRQLRALAKEVLSANGLLAKAQETRTSQGGDGTMVKRVVSTETLMSRLRKDLTHGQEKAIRSRQLDPHRPVGRDSSFGEVVGGAGGGGDGEAPPADG